MAAIFFERYVGKDAKVNDASSIIFFRDHLTFLDEVISEEKKKLGLLDLATQLKLKQQDFAAKQGIKLHGELKDRKGSEGHLPLDCPRNLCASGAVEHWFRTRTRRMWARSAASLSASAPPTFSIAGSRRTCG